MSADPAAFRFVSTNRRVREDRRFVVGHGHFVADVALEGLLHVAILPSQHPAARIAASFAAVYGSPPQRKKLPAMSAPLLCAAPHTRAAELGVHMSTGARPAATCPASHSVTMCTRSGGTCSGVGIAPFDPRVR